MCRMWRDIYSIQIRSTIIQNRNRTKENKLEFIKRLIDEGYLIVNERRNGAPQDVERLLIAHQQ